MTLLLALAGLAICLAEASADSPAPDRICAAARNAVQGGKAERSKILGFHSSLRGFSDVPAQGAVLIGFDLGLGPDGNIELIWALRPVFRTAQGEVVGRERGRFYDQSVPDGGRLRVIKSRVKRTVFLRAPAGYAVGGLTARAGSLINGLSLAYMKIDGEALDPRQTVNSAWVGDRTGGSERKLDGQGAPVVGVVGSNDDYHVMGLGLAYGKRPSAPPPVKRPPDTKKKLPPKEPEEEPAEVKADPVKPPKRAENPSPPEPPSPVMPVAAPNPPPAEGQNWLPIAIFGTVTVAIALPLFLLLRTNANRKESLPVSPKPADDEVMDVVPVPEADENQPQGITATLPATRRPAWNPTPEPDFSAKDAERAAYQQRFAQAQKEVVPTLFAIAGLQLLCGMIALTVVPDKVAGGPVPNQALPIIGALIVLVAFAFAGLGFWSRVQPFPAAVVGLALYVLIFLMDFVASPQAAVNGIIIKIGIIAALIRCVITASKIGSHPG